MNGNALFGRRVIYTNVSDINENNVAEIIQKASATHMQNRAEIEYLYRYYRGDQPVLKRQKDIRPEICSRVVENRANEIVTFKTAYLVGEPIQYVSCSGTDEQSSKEVERLNTYMNGEDKDTADEELCDWLHICGVAYRMAAPNHSGDCPEESPFHVYTLDPRMTFVVYHTGLGNKPVLGVTIVPLNDTDVMYACYTDNAYYEVVNGAVTKSEANNIGMVPIVCYTANPSLLGAFEIVLPLLDAINETASNRLDGVQQFIQSLMVLKGVDIDADDFKQLKEMGGIKVPVDGDVNYLVQELNQTATQTLMDDMYDTILTICGMPNRNGGNSTSDTGNAVIMRDGWSAAESRAKHTEKYFKKAERKFLRVCLKIASGIENSGISIKLSDIDIRFTRRNYENIQTKSQVLTTMLSSGKIHPKLAFESCGMFADPERAYNMSMDYEQEVESKLTEQLISDAGGTDENDFNG